MTMFHRSAAASRNAVLACLVALLYCHTFEVQRRVGKGRVCELRLWRPRGRRVRGCRHLCRRVDLWRGRGGFRDAERKGEARNQRDEDDSSPRVGEERVGAQRLARVPMHGELARAEDGEAEHHEGEAKLERAQFEGDAVHVDADVTAETRGGLAVALQLDDDVLRGGCEPVGDGEADGDEEEVAPHGEPPLRGDERGNDARGADDVVCDARDGEEDHETWAIARVRERQASLAVEHVEEPREEREHGQHPRVARRNVDAARAQAEP